MVSHVHRINDHAPESVSSDKLAELIELVKPISELAALVLSRQAQEVAPPPSKRVKSPPPAPAIDPLDALEALEKAEG